MVDKRHVHVFLGTMSQLKVGDPAPSFSAKDQSGKTISLSDLAGKTVVLYFYPKDDTPGCTKEACSFRDEYAKYQEKNIVVLGVSPDDIESHGKFAEKYSLPFPLLADEDKKIVDAYGLWVEKNLYGKKSFGVERSTFVIDGNGKISAIHRKVKAETHPSDLLGRL